MVTTTNGSDVTITPLEDQNGEQGIVYKSGNTPPTTIDGLDVVLADDMANTINGRAGNDIIYGGAGNDTLAPGVDFDVAYGGPGNDVFQIASGGGAFYGEADDDRFEILFASMANAALNYVSIFGGAGEDTLDFSTLPESDAAGGALTVTIATGGQSGLSFYSFGSGSSFVTNGNFTGIEHIIGAPGRVNNLTGDDQDNILVGAKMNDTLRGHGGNDILVAGTGEDTDSLAGTGDYVVGGAGNDIFVITDEAGTPVGIADFKKDNDGDKLAIEGNNTTTIWYAPMQFGVHIYTANGHIATLLDYTGTLTAADFVGLDENYDEVTSRVTVDNVVAVNGSATYKRGAFYVGGTGSDTVDASDVNLIAGLTWVVDLRDGSAESSTFYAFSIENFIGGVSEGKSVIYGNDKNNEITAFSSENGTASSTIYGYGGDDILTGGNNNDILNGGDDDDRLYGGEGNDTLRGDDKDGLVSGDDRLYGEAGDDTLWGGKGNDHLIGGSGKDTLYGNAGNDHFYLLDPEVPESFSTDEAAKVADSIGDFNSGDKIVLPDGLNTLFIVEGDSDNDQNLYLVSPTSDGMAVYGKISSSSVSANSLAGNSNYFKKGDNPDNLTDYTGLNVINVQEGDFIFAPTGNYVKHEPTGTSGVDVMFSGAPASGKAGIDRLDGGTGNDIYFMTADPTRTLGFADTVIYTEGDQIYLTGLEEAGLKEGEIIVALYALYNGAASNDKKEVPFHANSGDLVVLDSTGTQILLLIDLGNSTISHGINHNDFQTQVEKMFGNADDLKITTGPDGTFYQFSEGDSPFQASETIRADIYFIWDEDTAGGHTYGRSLDDILVGTDRVDNLYGGYGDDTLYGFGGDDIIYGNKLGQGNALNDDLPDGDTIYGGDGADKIYGGAGADIIHGGDGDDTIRTGSYNEHDGGAIDNYGHSDIVHGGSGADTIYGDGGNDTLNGDEGNDELHAYVNIAFVTMRLNGGEGNDTFVYDTADVKVFGDVYIDFENGDEIKIKNTAGLLTNNTLYIKSSEFVPGRSANQGDLFTLHTTKNSLNTDLFKIIVPENTSPHAYDWDVTDFDTGAAVTVEVI